MHKTACYLDYNATAPIRQQVFARIAELQAEPLNPSSVHANGRKAKQLLAQARVEIAGLLSVWPREVIFTASGTEANNTVLRQFNAEEVAFSAIEHSSILNALSFPSPWKGEGEV